MEKETRPDEDVMKALTQAMEDLRAAQERARAAPPGEALEAARRAVGAAEDRVARTAARLWTLRG